MKENIGIHNKSNVIFVVGHIIKTIVMDNVQHVNSYVMIALVITIA